MNSDCIAVVFPLVRVHERAESGHSVDSSDPPSGSVCFEPSANEVLARALDLSTANAAPLCKSLREQKVLFVRSKIAEQRGEWSYPKSSGRRIRPSDRWIHRTTNCSRPGISAVERFANSGHRHRFGDSAGTLPHDTADIQNRFAKDGYRRPLS